MAFEELIADMARYVVKKTKERELDKEPEAVALKELLGWGDSNVERDERGFRKIEMPKEEMKKEPQKIIDAEFVDL